MTFVPTSGAAASSFTSSTASDRLDPGDRIRLVTAVLIVTIKLVNTVLGRPPVQTMMKSPSLSATPSARLSEGVPLCVVHINRPPGGTCPNDAELPKSARVRKKRNTRTSDGNGTGLAGTAP